MRLRTHLLIAAQLLWLPTTVRASDMWKRIYHYQRADKARLLARRECKPLVIHFVPDSPLGTEQLQSFYAGDRRVSDTVLDRVVIVGVPREKFALFARQLGVMRQAGFRTISAYDLSTVDKRSTHTVYDGRWWGNSQEVHNVPPSVASAYFNRVAGEFTAYAQENYLPALDARDADVPSLLGGLRFIETRRLYGYEPRLRRILNTRYPGKIAREIEAACVGAMLATTLDPLATAGEMSRVAMRDLPVARRCEKALEQLGPHALQALLIELTRAHTGLRLRKLARLLSNLSNVPSPEPITFWGQADENRRTDAVTKWEYQIRLAGRL